nr:hypothetical protein [Streptococcus downei]
MTDPKISEHFFSKIQKGVLVFKKRYFSAVFEQ